MEKDQDQSMLIIRDLETLRVLADPLRTQIVEMLNLQPLTVRQTSDRLGLAPSRLYYHFNLLEKHGFVRVVETRMVANMVEKLYGAAARNITIDPNLLALTSDAGKESLPHLLASTIDATREDLVRSLQARLFEVDNGAATTERTVTLTRLVAQISEERAAEFTRRLTELVSDFETEQDNPNEAENQAYALTIAFYPSFYYAGEQPSEPGESK